MNYCERAGIEIDRIFRDEGESAKTANRTQLQAMLNYCAHERQRRDIKAVVTYRVDRLARNVGDHAMIRASLLKIGIQIRSATETFDDSPAGMLSENMMAVIAQFDNDVRAARTVAGMKEGLSRGRWQWKAPIGYLKRDRNSQQSLVPDPVLAPLVRLAFERNASRMMPRHEVLEEVTLLGLVTCRGKPMSLQSFGYMLRNPLYMGRIVKKEWGIDCVGDFEPLVSAELFESVQVIARGRDGNGGSRCRDHPDFPLRRIIRCGRCGRPLTASWSRGRSRRYPYYRCPTKGCRAVSVRKEHLENEFVVQLGAHSVGPEVSRLFSAVVEDAWTVRTKETQSQQMRFASRISDLERKQDKLVDAYLDGRGIDQSTYEQQSRRFDLEKKDLQSQLDRARLPKIDLNQTVAFAASLLQDLPGCWNRLNWQQKPHFARAIYPNGLTFENGSIGTRQTSWLLTQICAEASGELDLVPPTGFEPVFPP